MIGKHAALFVLRKYRIAACIVTGLVTRYGIVTAQVILVGSEKRSLPIVTVDVGINVPVSVREALLRRSLLI